MPTSSDRWPTVSGKPPRHHYGIFPWSVLDTTTTPWLNRRDTLAPQVGDGGQGRPEGLLYSGEKNQRISSGTSLFDPVLADCMYQWYAPHGGRVYDPFAGGTTRGSVAALHDMDYTGVDISADQVQANTTQAEAMGIQGVTWRHGDGTKAQIAPGSVDMVLTCPPYHDLERYTDDPTDLSCMDWEDHLDAIGRAAAQCYEALRDDRFLVWVTGDLRGEDGQLRLLPERTALALEKAGFTPVNTHVLVNAVGTRYLMARRWWTNHRTAGRLDQRVIVMVKGSRVEATRSVNEAFRRAHQNEIYQGSYPPKTFQTRRKKEH